MATKKGIMTCFAMVGLNTSRYEILSCGQKSPLASGEKL